MAHSKAHRKAISLGLIRFHQSRGVKHSGAKSARMKMLRRKPTSVAPRKKKRNPNRELNVFTMRV